MESAAVKNLILTYMTIIFLLSVSVIPVFAAPALLPSGMLKGKTICTDYNFSYGTAKWSTYGGQFCRNPTTNQTDGNMETEYYGGSGTDADSGNTTAISFYTFPTPVSIGQYALLGSTGFTANLKFYDSTGNLITQIKNIKTDYTQVTIPTVDNVKTVVIADTYSGNMSIYEWDVWTPPVAPSEPLDLTRGMNSLKGSVIVDNYSPALSVTPSDILPYKYAEAVNIATK
jgi:hypothetical protein